MGDGEYAADCKRQATEAGYGTEAYNKDEWEREWKRCVTSERLAEELGD